jgi:hypothetical protein
MQEQLQHVEPTEAILDREVGRKGSVRRRLTLLVGVCLALLGLLVVVNLPPPHVISEDQVKGLRMGMSQADIEAILGPAGDTRTYLTIDKGGNPISFPSVLSGMTMVAWETNNLSLFVQFDTAGHAQAWQFQAAYGTKQELVERFFWRTRRMWQQW